MARRAVSEDHAVGGASEFTSSCKSTCFFLLRVTHHPLLSSSHTHRHIPPPWTHGCERRPVVANGVGVTGRRKQWAGQGDHTAGGCTSIPSCKSMSFFSLIYSLTHLSPHRLGLHGPPPSPSRVIAPYPLTYKRERALLQLP